MVSSAEEAGLGEDGHVGVPILPLAEPALHRCLAVPGLQGPVDGGCRGEIPGVEVGQGVRPAQGRVHPVRRGVAALRPLRHGAKRPHGGWPQLGVAVIAGNSELRLAAAWRCVLQFGVLRRCVVCLVQ